MMGAAVQLSLDFRPFRILVGCETSGIGDVLLREPAMKPAVGSKEALGNSMAVNVMRWIGMRIQMVEEIVREVSA